jgi:large subunit ribosomal protein L18
MKLSKTYSLKLRRRREGKTNYIKRLALLKSGFPRAVIRKTNYRVLVQIIGFEEKGDFVICSTTSDELKKYNWGGSFKNIPACYLTGLLCGKKALKKGVNKAIADIGLQKAHKKGRIFSVLKGLIDAGIEIPVGEGIIDEERIKGKHIAEYILKAEGEQFSKTKDFAKNIMKEFEEIKKKIEGEFDGTKG